MIKSRRWSRGNHHGTCGSSIGADNIQLEWTDANAFEDQTASNPQAAAEFLKPWYQAMLAMIKSAEGFDQGPTTRGPGT